jgi:uncharacterized protein
MIRAVIDSNVVVSAHITPRGAPARVLRLWREDCFTLVISEPLLAETDRMLAHPKLRRFGVAAADALDYVQAVRKHGEVTPGDLVVSGAARDPKDDMVLAAALEGSADYIVTGDDDLLTLGRYEGIPIVAPAAFVQMVEGP